MPYQKYIWKKATSTWELVTYDAGIIAAGVFDDARIPNLAADKIVAGEEGYILKVISGLATWAAAGSGANNYLVSVSGSGNSDVTFVRDGLADLTWNAAHDHTFASLTSKPTTLSGYGITDAASNTHDHTFASLTSKPTTLSGYGITDALASTHPASAVTAQKITNWDTAYGWNDHAGLYRPVAWVPSWSDVTSKPSEFTPAAHTHGNITDDGKIGSTTDQVVTTTTGGLLTTSSRSGIDSRSTFPPSSHTHLWADITDKPSTFTPSAHTHGNITNAGAIGSTANLVIMTGADGVLGAKAAGTTSQYLRGDGSWVTPPNTTYSLMTSTVLGLGKLFSDTEQSVAANAVTATASRTYGIQVNANGQLVVNVPWVDTNTTYSEISEAEIDSNSSSTARLITGRRFHYGLRNIQTVSTTLNLGVGATASGNIKTINIGTGGVTGSNTLINLGNSLSTVTIAGNLVFTGTATSIDTTSLRVSDYIIEIAKDNTVALTGYAGFVIPKYDGTNAGGIIIDSAGEFRIGDISYVGNVITDVGSQPVLTRVEKAALADGDIFVWNSTNLNAEGKTLAEGNLITLTKTATDVMIATTAQQNVIESIRMTDEASDLPIVSKEVTLPKATNLRDGLMSSEDKDKLDNVEENAQKNSNILKSEIEDKLIGRVDTHRHITGLDISVDLLNNNTLREVFANGVMPNTAERTALGIENIPQAQMDYWFDVYEDLIQQDQTLDAEFDTKVDKNISSYTEKSAPTGSERLFIDDAGVPKRTLVSDIMKNDYKAQGLGAYKSSQLTYHDVTLVTKGDFKCSIKATQDTKQIFYVLFPTVTATNTLRLSTNDGTTYYNVVKNGNTMRASVVSGQLVRLQFNGTQFVADIQGDVEIVEEYSDAIESTYGQFNPHDGGMPIVREVQGRTIPALENLVTNGDFSGAVGVGQLWYPENSTNSTLTNPSNELNISTSASSGAIQEYFPIANNVYLVIGQQRVVSGTNTQLRIRNFTDKTILFSGDIYTSTSFVNMKLAFTTTVNRIEIYLRNEGATVSRYKQLHLFNLTASHGVTATSGTAYDQAVADIEAMLALNGGYISTTPTTHLEDSEFKSVGKNLWRPITSLSDRNFAPFVQPNPNSPIGELNNSYFTFLDGKIVLNNNVSISRLNFTLKLFPNTQYTLSYKTTSYAGTIYRIFGANAQSYNDNGYSKTFTTDAQGYINWGEGDTQYALYNLSGGPLYEIFDIQLEQGTVATTYAPYNTETQKFNHGRLSKLPNGAADKIRYNNGAYVLDRYVKEYTLVAGDITAITLGTNVDYLTIPLTKFSPSAVAQSTMLADGAFYVEGYMPEIEGDVTIDNVDYINRFETSDTNLFIVVAKGTYANLASAQTDLAGTKIWYQLATPLLATEVIDVDGTLIQESTTTIQQLQNIPTTYDIEFSMNTEQTTKTLVQRDKLQQQEIDNLEDRATALEARTTVIESKVVLDYKEYGVREVVGQSSSDFERVTRLWGEIKLGSATGLVANVAIDDADATNSFDYIPIFKREVVDIDATDLSGNTVSNAFVKVPKFYIKEEWVTEGETDYHYIFMSQFKHEGYRLPLPFKKPDGSERDYTYIGAYEAYLDGNNKLRSLTGQIPKVNYSKNNFRIAARALDGLGVNSKYQVTDSPEYVDLVQIPFMIEFATKHSQDVFLGATSMAYSESHTAIADGTSVNFIVVSNATGAAFVLGQTVSIGTSRSNDSIAKDRIVTQIDVDTPNAGETTITFDGAAVNIAIGNVVASRAWKTGMTDSVKVSGSHALNDGKHSIVWRGLENPFGNILKNVDGVKISNWRAYVAENPKDYNDTASVGGVYAEPYLPLGYLNANANNYVQYLGYDANYPYAKFPISVQASSGLFFRDYYYQNSGDRTVFVGGSWSNGSTAGLFSWYLRDVLGFANFDIGARLSYRP